MSSSDNARSKDRLHTEGIYRRALGEPESAAIDGLDELDRRTEPTLDGPPRKTAGSADATPSAAPATPPWEDDAPMPETARRPPLNVLRWGLASALTLTVSVAIGLVLLLAPGTTPKIADAPWLKAWLPQWAAQAVATIAGKPAADSPQASARTDATASASAASAVPMAPDTAGVPTPAATVRSAMPGIPAASASSGTPIKNPGASNPGTANATAAVGPAAAAPMADTLRDKAKNTAPHRTASMAPDALRDSHDMPQDLPPVAAAIPRAGTMAAPGSTAANPNPQPRSDPPKPSRATPAGHAASRAAQPDHGKGKVIASTRVTKGPARPASASDASAIRNAPPGSFFVQHVSLVSRADAQAWRARHGALKNARVVALTTPGKGLRYAVVSGPFASRKAAQAFAAQDGVASAPWLRPRASLQAALPAAHH